MFYSYIPMSRILRSIAVVVLCVFSALLVLLFAWLPRGGMYRFVSQKMWGPGLLWLAGASLEVKGAEQLDAKKDYIFYANHSSYYDIPALCAAVPHPLFFIAKREILKVPIFGWGMWAIGMVFVDRSNPEKARASMNKAALAIQNGKSVLAFPEGTRSRTGTLQQFKKGIFHVARQGPIAMVPIAISGSRQVLAHDGKLRRGHIHIQIGKPIDEDTIRSKSVNELASYTREVLDALLKKTPFQDGPSTTGTSALQDSGQSV